MLNEVDTLARHCLHGVSPACWGLWRLSGCCVSWVLRLSTPGPPAGRCLSSLPWLHLQAAQGWAGGMASHASVAITCDISFPVARFIMRVHAVCCATRWLREELPSYVGLQGLLLQSLHPTYSSLPAVQTQHTPPAWCRSDGTSCSWLPCPAHTPGPWMVWFP